MFRTKKGGIIESDEGFSLKLLGRAGLEYREGKKVMVIDSEMLVGSKIDFVIASNSIGRWKGGRYKIDAKEKSKIKNNIRKAFKSQGYNIRILKNF